MLILKEISELANIPGPLLLAIGVFDGVHLGHQAIVKQLAQSASEVGGTPVVATFQPHPMEVLHSGNAPKLLTSLRHKASLMEKLGISYVLPIPFTKEFSETVPESFVALLMESAPSLRAVCVGEQWRFGKGASGNVDLLRALGKRKGFQVIGIPGVAIDGTIASSTAIREAVENGDLLLAQKFLGRPFSVVGTVTQGAGRGRELGFPTANFSTFGMQLPPDGVYAVEILHGENPYHGVANLGYRPSVEPDAKQRILEAHLLNFSGNLYGCELELIFKTFLRAEQKFATLLELQKQITEDVRVAAKYFDQK